MIMKIIQLIITLSIILNASNFNSFIDAMKKKQKFYQDRNASKKVRAKIISDFNLSTEKIINSKKELLDSLQNKSLKSLKTSIPWVTKHMISEVEQKELDQITNYIINGASNTKVDTIFYLFSTSQNPYVFYNFIQEANKLESINEDIKYYGVLQGMINHDELDKLYKPFKYKKHLEGKAKIKMQFFIYKDLDLDRVPAFLFSKCPSKNFKYSECENKYLVRGEISLLEALNVVSKENDDYLKYLEVLENEGL